MLHAYSALILQVVDSWPVLDKRQSAAGLHQAGLFCESEATENHVYFKLLRLPGQPPLTSVQVQLCFLLMSVATSEFESLSGVQLH